MKYWRQAASLIVTANRTRNVAKSPQTAYGSTGNPSNSGNQQGLGQGTNNASERIVRSPNDVDYSVLLLQRAQSSTFFAGAEVFPGGALDDADFSPDWVELFKDAGMNSMVDFGKMLTIQGKRPLVFTEKREAQSPPTIPSELAFRICAIREAFEEAGVLMLKSFQDVQKDQPTEVTFAKNYQHPNLSESNIDEWRHRVHEDAHQFIVLCRTLQCIPDVWSLMEWSDWLTPSTNKKRYDTMFFMCCMKDVPEVKHDAKETIQVKWSTSAEALQAYKDKHVYLPPPQVYELSRMSNFKTLQDLFDFSSQRAFLGCEVYLPVLFISDDGKVVSAYPGDDIYPKQVVFKTFKAEEMPLLNKTVEQSLKECIHLNRMVFINSSECSLYYNIVPSCGHVPPVQYNIPGGLAQSKM